MKKKAFLFSAFIILTFVFGYIKAEQGDLSTLGYDTPNSRSYWRVDSSGHLKPGVTAALDVGTSALAVRTVYAGAVSGANFSSGGTISGTTITGTIGTFSGQLTLQSVSSTTLKSLVPVSTGTIVFCSTYNTVCVSSGIGTGAWVFQSTGTNITLISCAQ